MERCLELFELHQKRLFFYIRALVPDPAEAEEILHETNIVVWKKVDEFRPGSDFFQWISRIAHFQILEQRRRRANSRISFSPELIDQLARSARGAEPGRDHHKEAFCMWMAGGGSKPPTVHGETDDLDFNVVRDPVHVHDLNATILHLLGVRP